MLSCRSGGHRRSPTRSRSRQPRGVIAVYGVGTCACVGGGSVVPWWTLVVAQPRLGLGPPEVGGLFVPARPRVVVACDGPVTCCARSPATAAGRRGRWVWAGSDAPIPSPRQPCRCGPWLWCCLGRACCYQGSWRCEGAAERGVLERRHDEVSPAVAVRGDQRRGEPYAGPRRIGQVRVQA